MIELHLELFFYRLGCPHRITGPLDGFRNGELQPGDLRLQAAPLGLPFGVGLFEFQVCCLLNAGNSDRIDTHRLLLGGAALGAVLLRFGQGRLETIDLPVQPPFFGAPAFRSGFQFFLGLFLLTLRLLQLGFIFGLNFLCLLPHTLFVHSGGL